MRSGYWQDLTTRDFDGIEAESTVAVLPVAAVEQHGPHLPLATDSVINDGIVEHTLRRLPPESAVLVLPALTVGASLEHTQYAGTLSIDAAVLMDAWLDIGRSVARAGVRKLVIFNSHGGQRALVDLVALKLRAECRLLAVRASYFHFGVPDGLFDPDEVRYGIHGGELETSLMLHLRPESVRRDALVNVRGLPARFGAQHSMLGVDKPAGFGWMGEDLDPSGVCGHAARADAVRGERYLSYLTERFAVLLGEVAATPLGILD
jgi:creatinine amidohydrolase